MLCAEHQVKCHFEMKHEKTFKNQGDKAESIKHAVSMYDKHVVRSKFLPLHGKPFTVGKFIKEAFLSCSDALV